MATGCLGTNRDGGPCSGHVSEGQTWCQWHDPEREAERQEWRRRGGQRRSNKQRAAKQLSEQVLSIADLDALLCLALKRVGTGSMEPGVGSSMAGIAKTIVGIRTASDLERRIEELERSAGIGSNVRRFGP